MLYLFYSSILWTKYGLLTDDTPIFTVGVLGIVLQSLYLLFYYVNTRDKVCGFFLFSFELIVLIGMLLHKNYFDRRPNSTLWENMAFKQR